MTEDYTSDVDNVSLDVGLDDTTVYMLTTLDNPYNPFTQFDLWRSYDSKAGYNSNELLSRIAKVSDELSERSYRLAINTAIDEIIEHDPLNMYIKVTEESFRIRVSG